MREKSNSGKKPVRRSKSEEKDPPKVYRPRTSGLTVKKAKPSEGSENYSPDENHERSSSIRTKETKERSGAKKVLRRDPKPEKFDSKREGRSNSRSDSPSYRPRTLKSKSFDKDYPEKKIRKDRDFEDNRESSRGKSFYEDKFAKPKFAKRVSSDDREFSSPSDKTLKKRPKTFVSPPEIDNEIITDKDGLIRLNKYISNSGLCSRREADDYIEKGFVTVNGEVVKELGVKVKLTDEICFKEKQLDPERKVYILLNKPKDYVTTVEDPNATKTVMDLIRDACKQRVYPVGRLDRNSTGLLLFTNDGELTTRLTHPSFMKKKIYEVGLDRNVTQEDIKAIREGVDIEGEVIAADAIDYVDDNDRSTIGIEIHSGQNRIVRRIFEKLNYRVTKLDRVYFAGLTKKNLPRGKWRFLNQKEVNMLKMNRFK